MKRIWITMLFLIFCNAGWAQESLTNEQIAKEVVESLQSGKYQKVVTHFDSTMTVLMNAEKLEAMWKQLNQQAGTFQYAGNLRSMQREGFDIIIQQMTFEQMSLDMVLPFDDKQKIAGMRFMPAQNPETVPQTSEFWEEKNMELKTGKFTMPALLTLPKNVDNPPVVILVHGSGPNDKDETIGPNKPFKDLAHGLAEKGIATFRYDKRSMVYGSQMTAEGQAITVEPEVIEDALSAVKLLKNDESVDSGQIYLLGHSLGGMLAPRIASRTDDLAGLILMAGSARPLEDHVLEQVNYMANLDGELTEEEKSQLVVINERVEAVKKLKSPETEGKMLLELPASYWYDLNNYDPLKTAKKLDIPVLVLQGGRDYQVTTEDFELWKKKLSKGKKRERNEFKSYPALNHLFLEGEGKSGPSEYTQEGHIPDYVIEDIVLWIKSL